jgi:hypothetical protein
MAIQSLQGKTFIILDISTLSAMHISNGDVCYRHKLRGLRRGVIEHVGDGMKLMGLSVDPRPCPL